MSRGSCSPTGFNESDSLTDTTRADFIRAQCAGAQQEAKGLFLAHAWRWTALTEPPSEEWSRIADLMLPNFERGFVTRLRIIAGALGSQVPIRWLIADEPVTDVLFEIGEASRARAAEARRLLPFPHPISVKLVRQPGAIGSQDAFAAALLSSPLMASASALDLNALNPARHRSALVAWLTRSPFLRNLRNLSLRQNALTCLEAHVLARSARLRHVTHLDVTNNRIEDPGAAALYERFGAGLVI